MKRKAVRNTFEGRIARLIAVEYCDRMGYECEFPNLEIAVMRVLRRERLTVELLPRKERKGAKP